MSRPSSTPSASTRRSNPNLLTLDPATGCARSLRFRRTLSLFLPGPSSHRMSTEPLFLGLDVGTQSVRAALFDLSGACRGYGTAGLDTFHPRSGWAEQDPVQWW